jgi:outer membrane protein assembly factor BamD
MFQLRNFSLFSLLIFSLLVTSCSRYQRILKSSNYDEKYEAAIDYYERGEWNKSLPLLEELTTVLRGTTRGEKVHYYFAYTNFYLEDYELASYHFKNFARTYPASSHTEECMFMSAKCYYLSAPVSSLDQANSIAAINEFQLFVNLYPQSKFVTECNELIDKLRLKLQTKAFDNAKLYYNIGEYKAATVAFNNVLKDFPDTKYREEIMYLTIRSWYLYAKNSIDSKKAERYSQLIETYLKFVDSFPNSRFLKDAEGHYSDALKEKEKLKSQNL